MGNNHTNSADEITAGYSAQISRYFESGLIGKYKPDVNFHMVGPYETGFKNRCILRVDNDYSTLSVPQAKALFLQIGRALGVSDYRLGIALSKVPYDKRIID